MTRNAALAELQNSLHISHGQIFSYLSCGLKYRFQYAERRPPERLSISLPFGKAIHASLERYYLGKQQGITEPLDLLEDLFAEQLAGEIQATDIPVIFKKETPDLASAIAMGICASASTTLARISWVRAFISCSLAAARARRVSAAAWAICLFASACSVCSRAPM